MFYYVDIQNGKITSKNSILITVSLVENQKEISGEMYNQLQVPATFETNAEGNITNFTPVPPTLYAVQQAKITEVTTAYQVELYSTFISSATGTELDYDYSRNSEALWKELKDGIRDGDIPDTVFPMNITLANGMVVTHTKAELQQIFGEVTMRKLQLYSKWQSMVVVGGTILSTSTVEEVNAISW